MLMLILLKYVLKLYKINIFIKGVTETILYGVIHTFIISDDAKVRKKVESTKGFYDFNIILTFGLSYVLYHLVVVLCIVYVVQSTP